MKSSGKAAKILGIILVAVCIIIFVVVRRMELVSDNYNTNVEKWDNIYSGNNIEFYYINNNIQEITSLSETYDVGSVVSEVTGDLNTTVALDQWLREKCSVSLDVMDSNKDTNEILSTMFKNSTISQKDYNVVMQELLASANVRTRIGEYGGKDVYSVLEIFDKELNKWVAYDVLTGGYFVGDNGPLSGVELVDADISSIRIATNDGEISINKKAMKKLKESEESYTVKIDNSKYEGTLINSVITYVKDQKDIQLESKRGYIQPSIFVSDTGVFELNPWKEYEDDQSDSIPTLIFAKRNVKEDGEKYIKFSLGAFQNSVMLNDFYVRINDGDYIKVNSYYDLSVEQGENKIELSLDGVNALRTVVINHK